MAKLHSYTLPLMIHWSLHLKLCHFSEMARYNLDACVKGDWHVKTRVLVNFVQIIGMKFNYLTISRLKWYEKKYMKSDIIKNISKSILLYCYISFI